MGWQDLAICHGNTISDLHKSRGDFFNFSQENPPNGQILSASVRQIHLLVYILIAAIYFLQQLMESIILGGTCPLSAQSDDSTKLMQPKSMETQISQMRCTGTPLHGICPAIISIAHFDFISHWTQCHY